MRWISHWSRSGSNLSHSAAFTISLLPRLFSASVMNIAQHFCHGVTLSHITECHISQSVTYHRVSQYEECHSMKSVTLSRVRRSRTTSVVTLHPPPHCLSFLTTEACVCDSHKTLSSFCCGEISIPATHNLETKKKSVLSPKVV